MRVLRISHSAVVGAWRERETVLRRMGLDVRLLCAHVWNEGGGNVRLQPDRDENVAGVRTFGAHPILFLYDPRPIWRELGRDWDVIDIHEEPYALATAEILLLRWLRRQRAPFVLYSAQNINKRYPPPFRWFEKWALRRVAGLSACNSDAIRIARGKGLLGIAAYIPLGVDTARFRPRRADERDPGEFVVGYVGRLESHKGVSVLLDAVGGDKRILLRIAGGGPNERLLQQRAAELDLAGRVQFLGHIGQDELAGFYRELDVLAVPSIPTPGWLEQFCRVAVEAMASGVPVVASHSGALPEVIDTAGLLVPPSDSVALREAIGTLYEDRELLAQLREVGLRRARDFSWQRVGSDYARLYRAITGTDRWVVPPAAGNWDAANEMRDGRAHVGVGVEVIVVAYGTPELFVEAISPLVGCFSLSVVDNSADPSIRAATEAAGGRYLDPGENLGFGAGVNYALKNRQCPGADILLLNPDAVIDAAGIEQLQKHLHADPGLASVGPAQVDAQGHPARVLWPFPTPGRAWLEAVGLGGLRSTSNYVIGSVMLINARALQSVGGFDERFFLYAEETDWAYRAHRAGWSHALVPSVTAMHHGAGTGGDPIYRETVFHASNELYLRKHFGPVGWEFARAAVVAGAFVRSILLPPGRRAEARRRMRLYAAGPTRKLAQRSGI